MCQCLLPFRKLLLQTLLLQLRATSNPTKRDNNANTHILVTWRWPAKNDGPDDHSPLRQTKNKRNLTLNSRRIALFGKHYKISQNFTWNAEPVEVSWHTDDMTCVIAHFSSNSQNSANHSNSPTNLLFWEGDSDCFQILRTFLLDWEADHWKLKKKKKFCTVFRESFAPL